MIAIVEFTIPGQPIPKARARTVRTRNGGICTFTPETTRRYEAAVKAIARAHCSVPTVYPVRVSIALFMSDNRRRDCSNTAKGIEDAMNGIVYVDDTQIVDLHVTKQVDREHPRAIVRVEAA